MGRHRRRWRFVGSEDRAGCAAADTVDGTRYWTEMFAA